MATLLQIPIFVNFFPPLSPVFCYFVGFLLLFHFLKGSLDYRSIINGTEIFWAQQNRVLIEFTPRLSSRIHLMNLHQNFHIIMATSLCIYYSVFKRLVGASSSYSNWRTILELNSLSNLFSRSCGSCFKTIASGSDSSITVKCT